MNTLMSEFKESEYYQRIFKNHKVVLLYISGSRLCGITDERSDYDLISIVDEDNPEMCPNEFIMYDDSIKIHWYYISFKTFKDLSVNGTNLNIVGGIQFRNINSDTILYQNKEYESQINELLSEKEIISNNSCKALYHRLEKLVDDIISDNAISEKNYTKMIYHLCLASYYLVGDEPDIEFLKKIKRIRWQPVSDEYKDLAVKRLKILKDKIKEDM